MNFNYSKHININIQPRFPSIYTAHYTIRLIDLFEPIASVSQKIACDVTQKEAPILF